MKRFQNTKSKFYFLSDYSRCVYHIGFLVIISVYSVGVTLKLKRFKIRLKLSIEKKVQLNSKKNPNLNSVEKSQDLLEKNLQFLILEKFPVNFFPPKKHRTFWKNI